MRSRYEVTLNGISLENLGANIVILDVSYQPSVFADNNYKIAKRNGSRSDGRTFNSISVSVTFEIHEYSTLARQSACNAVCTWAKNGGRLEINDRSGQFLQCVCSQFPSVSSVRNWTDPFTITFTANVIPFWQEIAESSITLDAGTSGEGILFVPGCVDGALVQANIHTNAALTNVTLSVNQRLMNITGITVESDKDIKITYNDQAIQSIMVDTTSLLNKRYGVDDLLAKCGEINGVGFASDASVTVTFSTRGYWI